MKWIKRAVAALLLLAFLVAASVVVYGMLLYRSAGRGEPLGNPPPMAQARDAAAVAEEAARQRAARAGVERGESSQILFGDLHVHTHYSADSQLQVIQIADRESGRPPADACDFARFCSQLDFWSLNDHAESLTPELWRYSVDAIRQCNAASGDPANPDLVSFLGWEWSHASPVDPTIHYGHKNVILRDTEEGAIPVRPIASRPGGPLPFIAMGVIAPLTTGSFDTWSEFHRYAQDAQAVEECPEGWPVRALPEDCRESATDPKTLFKKLDDWGFPALVIPHGLSWGITNPVGADLANQLEQHDPKWQPLLEVYSGHGNSELYREFEAATPDEAGLYQCPEAGEGVEPCCRLAARLARERCDDPSSDACEAEVRVAVEHVARRSEGVIFSAPLDAVPGTTAEEWGACNQLDGTFLPSWNYRPKQSAQYGYALGSVGGEATDARFRFGLIGASDTHRSRPGTGYKEFGRFLMTDGLGYPMPEDITDERATSFYYTGGLAAVHAEGRDRGSVFDALSKRRVYATSGDRILLWFDLLAADGTRRSMGEEVVQATEPSFEVRAVGAFAQKPGCPPHVQAALPNERIASLCLGECYHPSSERRAITRIEVVRIRPQQSADEAIRPLVEDPWKVIACDGDPAGCVARFRDPEYARSGRETLYYVRAIQEATPAINGDPLSCERDAEGVCVRGAPCGTLPGGLPDDCTAPVEERAWSSPIFLDPAPRS